jgi:predicted nucleotide-binding protein (sugar kinase/HSP70/actin superfamily)
MSQPFDAPVTPERSDEGPAKLDREECVQSDEYPRSSGTCGQERLCTETMTCGHSTSVCSESQIIEHFRRPPDRPFIDAERDRVTILFGGFTWKHERFIEAMFRSSGYRCQKLPTADIQAFNTGKEFGNNGQCNPTYFTVGNLIKFLQALEGQGLSRETIVDRYLFFTAGSCGPCRFGMYESEYRIALDNAGFTGFRILLYHADQVTKQASNNPGMKLSVDFNMGALNMLNLGDVLNDMEYQLRPYEVVPGSTDQAIEDVVAQLSHFIETRKKFEIQERASTWLAKRLATRRRLNAICNTIGKIYVHLYGNDFVKQLRMARERLSQVEVDRTRVKPLVKITGEFWAQLTEGDGNFNMFAFLEQEGAQVLVESIGGWITYLLYQSRSRFESRRGLDFPHPDPGRWQWGKKIANEWSYHRKRLLLRFSEGAWNHLYTRTARHLGGVTQPLVKQDILARLAHPYYNSLARGGEGHLEVAKNLYYSTKSLCHMVLALKPFGCMPSLQSDGVQSGLVNHYPGMNFLSVETSGEGAIHAYSRVQMALGEAKHRARAEFDRTLASTGKSLDSIRSYAAEHRELRNPLYPVPRRRGVTGVAANFILHVNDLMEGKTQLAVLG